MSRMTGILVNRAIVLAICLLPAACSAETLFNFTFSATGSSATVADGILVSLGENISTVTINGVAYSGLTDQLTEVSFATYDRFSISGALNGALAGVAGTWLVFQTQPSVAMQNGAGDYLVTYGNGTALDSISGVIASNLGVTFNTGAGGVSLGVGNGALIDSLGMVESNVLFARVSSAPVIPEPSSCLMLGTGLIVMFTAGRKLFAGHLPSGENRWPFQRLFVGQRRNSRYSSQVVSPGQILC